MIKCGILLAGGTGSRLKPFTNIYSKQLIYLAGKAVIDYPIQTLIDLGVENLTIILGSSFAGQIVDYCGNGDKYGIKINYIYQGEPEGISHAINLCERFIDDKFYVILGDNIFEEPVSSLSLDDSGARIFIIKHPELEKFGVASLDNKLIAKRTQLVKIEEKPKNIDYYYENYAITGLYQFDQRYFDFFSKTKKSHRQEYEVTDIIRSYYEDDDLDYQIIDGDWNDAGTIDGLAKLNYKLLDKQMREYGGS
jgi:glucose-1-phosphate thymidylyltransferase